MFKTTTIEEISVAYVAGFGNPATVAGKAFSKLESKVPLKGNKFYGVFYPDRSEYRACVEVKEENNQFIVDLERDIIPGGLYATTTLEGDYNYITREIKPTFDAMEKEHQRDAPRPSVEFYRRHTEAILMLPIVG